MKLFSKSKKENLKAKKSNVQPVDKKQLEKVIGGATTTNDGYHKAPGLDLPEQQ